LKLDRFSLVQADTVAFKEIYNWENKEKKNKKEIELKNK